MYVTEIFYVYRILQKRLELNRSLALDDQRWILKAGRKRTNFHEQIRFKKNQLAGKR